MLLKGLWQANLNSAALSQKRTRCFMHFFLQKETQYRQIVAFKTPPVKPKVPSNISLYKI